MLGLGLDFGASIGRVISSLLLRICIATDVTAPQAQFASQTPLQDIDGPGCVGEVFVMEIKEWVPRAVSKYDVV